MPYTPVSVESFGGLDLLNDATAIGLDNAVDLLNVDFDRPGWLRTRNGSVKANATTLTAVGYQALFPSPTNGGELLASRGSTGMTLDKMTSAGVTTNIGVVAGTASPLDYAAIGSLTTTTLYMTFYDPALAGITIRKYDGTTLGSGTGKPLHVAVTPWDSRLVQGGYFAAADSPSGANGSRSTLFFSDPLAPDTYGANNFVTLRAGDGEAITAMVSWQNLLFVFKQTSMWVFYGTGVDSSGQPTWDKTMRRVDLPEPIADPVGISSRQFAVAGTDAVYYVTPAGIYRTAGDVPQPMSMAVNPAFSADSVNVSSAVRGSLASSALSWAAGRLVFAYSNIDGGVRQLVWHRATNTWTIWSLPGKSYVAFPPVGNSALLRDFMYFPNGNDIWDTGPVLTTDGGVAIAWSYTTGYSDIGGYFRGARIKSAERKNVRETDILGTGTVTHQLLTLNGRPNDVADPGGSVTLGTAPAIARGKRRRAARGTHVAHKLSGSGFATVTKLAHWLSGVEQDT